MVNIGSALWFFLQNGKHWFFFFKFRNQTSVKSRKGCFICTLRKTSCCIITSCHKQAKCRDLCWNKVLDTTAIECFCADKPIHQNFAMWQQYILSSFPWQLDSVMKMQDTLWGYICQSFTIFEGCPPYWLKKKTLIWNSLRHVVTIQCP